MTTTTRYNVINANVNIKSIVSNFTSGDLMFLRATHADGFTIQNINNLGANVTVPQYGYVILFYSGLKWFPIGGNCTIS